MGGHVQMLLMLLGKYCISKFIFALANGTFIFIYNLYRKMASTMESLLELLTHRSKSIP